MPLWQYANMAFCGSMATYDNMALSFFVWHYVAGFRPLPRVSHAGGGAHGYHGGTLLRLPEDEAAAGIHCNVRRFGLRGSEVSEESDMEACMRVCAKIPEKRRVICYVFAASEVVLVLFYV